MAASMAPRTRRTAQNTQLTYNLSRRVNDVQTYPFQSPQGATILVYGHDTGVTIVWRGGRRFKIPKNTPPEERQNGAADDSVMIIDSDDDEPAAKSQSTPKLEDNPQFEDEVDETPFPEIIQTLDLTLGTAVLNVAVMPLASMPSEDGVARAPILGDHMVFAVSCITKDVYVVSLPLTPPSPESKARPELKQSLLAGKAGSGVWGESLVLLGGQTKLSDGIAIGLVLPDSSERSAKSERAVVAAHSQEASGVLRLWDVPLDPKAKLERVEPFQTEFLPTPLTSISFNPTHRTQILAVSSPHGVRIYDFRVPSLPPDPDVPGPFPAQGSWLLTLYQPFSRPSSMRKPIVDAAWIAHGRAVFALLADGMWGIWDIDGVAIGTAGPAMSARLKLGVRGAALTAFSVSGYVEGTSSLRSVTSQHKESHSGDFAPMTPHTRRQAIATISSAATADRLATIHGGIKVTSLPSAGKAPSDESLVLWVGSHEHVCVIPGVSRFWESQLKKGNGGGVNLFSGSQPTRMLKLQDLSTGLLGERLCGVALIKHLSKCNHTTYNEGGLPVEVLVQGETRLVAVREGDDGGDRKVSGVISSRKRVFSNGGKTDAIIVHGKQSRAASASFNLSTVKPGSLRLKPSFHAGDETKTGGSTQASNGQQAARPRLGFNFTDELNAAADVTEENLSRDVDAEMLDIMGIDQALESMEGNRGAGRKKVLFEED